MRDLLFKSRSNRDAYWREHGGQRYSIRGQYLHPEYVEDEEPEARSDNGFGNTRYKTFYAVLYGLRDVPEPRTDSLHPEGL